MYEVIRALFWQHHCKSVTGSSVNGIAAEATEIRCITCYDNNNYYGVGMTPVINQLQEWRKVIKNVAPLDSPILFCSVVTIPLGIH